MVPYKNACVDNGVRGRLRGLRGRMVCVDKTLSSGAENPSLKKVNVFNCGRLVRDPKG